MMNRNLLFTSIAAVSLAFASLSANADDKGMSSDMMNMHKDMQSNMMKMSDMAKKEGLNEMADMYKNMGDMMDDMMKMMETKPAGESK